MRIKSKGGKVHSATPSTYVWVTLVCTGRSLAPGAWSEVTEGITCKSCIKKLS